MAHRLASLVALAALGLHHGASVVHAHGGGGGGHMGGFGGGHMGGGGGGGMRAMPGGFSAGGRGFDGPRDAGGMSGMGGGARGLDGGRALDGGRDFGGLEGGHFAGEHTLSKADFQRIADQGLGRAAARDGLGRDALARGAVRPYSMNALADRGAAVRDNFYRGGWYGGRGWYGDHFNAWWPGAWWGGFGWGMGAGLLTGLAWSELAGWGGYGAPVAYNYGTNVCYEDDGVYVQGARVGSATDYAAQAATLAAQGGADATIAADDQWRPLGVFALARSEETNPSTFMSLAIDKDGVLRGTYYDAVSDSTQNITGKVDKKSQKAAWTIGGKKTPVYEAGLTNLLQRQTTILVHRDAGQEGGGKVEQMLLVRVDDARGAAATTDVGRSGS